MNAMQKCRVTAAVVVGLLTILLNAPVPASATGTLDQSQTATSQAAVSAGGTSWVAQTFTAGITGGLDQVDLFLFRVGSPGDLTVQIQDVSEGVPSGSILASATVSEASVMQATGGANPPFTWVSVPLSPPAPVTAGTQYAIVLSAPNAPAGINFYGWSFVSFDPYAAGELMLSRTSGSTWGDFADIFEGTDTAFKTYVTPPPALPTSITQCLHRGWLDFPDFKNEGDCVSFVATGGKNQPS
jgi:hypothetical protein